MTILRSVTILGLALAASFLPARAHAQDRGTNVSPGLAIGSKAPAFTLHGQDGRERTLAEFLQKGKVALVFYRSADW